MDWTESALALRDESRAKVTTSNVRTTERREKLNAPLNSTGDVVMAMAMANEHQSLT